MKPSIRAFGVFLLLPYLSFVSACGGDDGDPTDPGGGGGTPSISISLAGTSINIAAGESGQVTVNVTRSGGFSGAVALTADAPTGVTVTPATIAAGATSGTITFQVGASVAAGTLQATVRASGQGVEEVTSSVSLVIAAAAGAFTLTLNPGSVQLQQGGEVSTTVEIDRTDGFDGSVSFEVDALPQGVSASFDPSSTTGGSSALTLTAAAGATVGAATVTVTGSADGLSPKTANLGVTVEASGGGGSGNVSWAFCNQVGVPVWFAYQDGSGPWTSVALDAQNTATFQMDSDRGGVAWIRETGGSPITQVAYYTRDELIFVGESQCEGGGDTKTVHGSVTALAATETASISLGSAFALASGSQGTTFTLNKVPDGPQDLVASRAEFDLAAMGIIPDRLLIRRNLNPADGATLPPLDFETEGFDPATADVTVNGLEGNEQTTMAGIFTTERGALGTYVSGIVGGASLTFWGFPSDQLETGDFHYMQVVAGDFSGSSGQSPDTRQVGMAFREVADKVVDLGPLLSTPTVSTVATAPTARLRAQWNLQAEYDRFVMFSANQVGGTDTRTILLMLTEGFLDGAAAVDLEIPDLSTASGWNDAWGLAPGTAVLWTANGTGWQGPGVINFPEFVDGARYLSATRSGTITP